MKIALVTYNDAGKYPGEGAQEDQRLLHYLQNKGLDISFQIWTDPLVRWEDYEIVVLKSPWDYFDLVPQFRQWIDHLESKQVRVLNPLSVIRWNHDKRYLLDIEKAGFDIVPTRVLPAGHSLEVDQYFAQWATNTLIVKPVVSGGAKNTFAIPKAAETALLSQVESLVKQEAYLVQPFMPEVKSQGEWSLLFFNGQFSHCVRKVPQTGDFRVQHYFGGLIIPTDPPAFIREAAQGLVRQFAPGCLYARVDGLSRENRFYLMELELIEPMLYMGQDMSLYENYYQALQQLLPATALAGK